MSYDAPSGEIPQDLVAVGAPASFEDWSEELRKHYFTGAGSEPHQEVGGDPAEEIEVLAIADTGGGEALA